ncbi:hypothetical protein BH10PSE2_BH10PSE2_07110 [soil metagenome]
MRKMLIAVAAGLMTLSALPATAGSVGQERPYGQSGPMNGPMNHGPMSGPMNHGDMNGPGQGGSQYGRWDDSWGHRPMDPPRNWNRGRHNGWYQHVRACSQRYRSYNPRTDTFVVRRGRTAVCRL